MSPGFLTGLRRWGDQETRDSAMDKSPQLQEKDEWKQLVAWKEMGMEGFHSSPS